ncbi:hypothetical protein [Bacillus cereus]|nr:hypothetical protein [Bacillus cereus]
MRNTNTSRMKPITIITGAAAIWWRLVYRGSGAKIQTCLKKVY